jgi:hypothetical protein
MRACIGMLALAYAAPAGASSFAMGPNLDGKTFLLVGVDVGVVLDDDRTSWLVGGEASVVRLYDSRKDTPFWIGGYLDTVVDGIHDQARLSLGAEAGYGVIGVDAGPVLELGGQGAISVRARAVLTLGVVTLYGGPVFPVTGSGSTWGELGILLKAPILR